MCQLNYLELAKYFCLLTVSFCALPANIFKLFFKKARVNSTLKAHLADLRLYKSICLRLKEKNVSSQKLCRGLNRPETNAKKPKSNQSCSKSQDLTVISFMSLRIHFVYLYTSWVLLPVMAVEPGCLLLQVAALQMPRVEAGRALTITPNSWGTQIPSARTAPSPGGC